MRLSELRVIGRPVQGKVVLSSVQSLFDLPLATRAQGALHHSGKVSHACVRCSHCSRFGFAKFIAPSVTESAGIPFGSALAPGELGTSCADGQYVERQFLFVTVKFEFEVYCVRYLCNIVLQSISLARPRRLIQRSSRNSVGLDLDRSTRNLFCMKSVCERE